MARILVIDDEHVVRMLVVEILESAGYEITAAESAERALTLLEREEFDLVVSDIVMPGLSGLELLEKVRTLHAALPVVLVTGAGTYDTLSQALTRGAAGLVTKPFAHADLQSAVADALERASRSADELKERLLAPTLASALANAIEARDSYLHGHCERLAALAVRLAELYGLAPAEVETVRLGAILHDIGKIGIPDRVLLKPSPLDIDERRIVETHPEIGDKLLEPLELLAGARPIVRHHHERWDGAGYPDGLAAATIPLGARIVAVADSVEVMSSRQLYRQPKTTDELIAELRTLSGAQWDPAIVALALELFESGELQISADGFHLLERPIQSPVVPSMSILLVEDRDSDALVVTEALERSLDGAIVARARSVAGATQLVSNAMWSLAVVDSQLPDGDGTEVLDTLRAAHPGVPVLMLTPNHGNDDAAVEALRHGASDYVVKNGSLLSALMERIQSLVGPDLADSRTTHPNTTRNLAGAKAPAHLEVRS